MFDAHGALSSPMSAKLVLVFIITTHSALSIVPLLTCTFTLQAAASERFAEAMARMVASQRRLKQRLVESTRDMIECAAAMRSHEGGDHHNDSDGHDRAHRRADVEGDDDGMDMSAAGDDRVRARGGRRGDVSVTSSPDSRAQTQTPNAADSGCVV